MTTAVSIQKLRLKTLKIAAVVTAIVPLMFLLGSVVGRGALADPKAWLTGIAMVVMSLLSVCTLWLIRGGRFRGAVTVYLAGNLLVTAYATFFATPTIFLARTQLGMAFILHLALALEPRRRAWRWILVIVIIHPALMTIRRLVNPDGILAESSVYVMMMLGPVFVFLAIGTIGSLTLRALQESVDVATKRANTLESIRRDLVAARDDALSSTRAKSAFLATMSHELRTPLNVIIGYSELVLENVPEEFEFSPDIDRVRGAGLLLLGLINEILDLAKIEAGRSEVVVARFSLRVLLCEIVEMTKILVQSSGPSIRLEAPDGPLMVSTDRAKLRQLLVNLIGNAAKFTESGSITLSVNKGDQRLLIAVRDTGIGISSEQLEKIFEPFTQVDGTPSREYEGTGLGLAIARELSELLGGSLVAESSVDEGSVFTLTLSSDVCDHSTPNEALVVPAAK